MVNNLFSAIKLDICSHEIRTFMARKFTEFVAVKFQQFSKKIVFNAHIYS
jgi:hypothetical protein